MRLLAAFVAVTAGAGPLAAQTVELTVNAGVRSPLGGSLSVPYRVAPPLGPAYVVTRSYRETSGAVVGLLSRIRLRGALSMNAGASATVASRTTPVVDVDDNCGTCGIVLLSGQLGVSARRAFGARLRIEATAGTELIRLGGEAYAEPLRDRSREIVPTSRMIGATTASLGARRVLQRGGAVRFDLQLRRYNITSRWVEPAFNTSVGRLQSKPHSDLSLTLGWTPRAHP